MSFTSADLDTILAATGEDVTITLSGGTVKTIKGKFRKNFQTASPYQMEVGLLSPAVMVKTSDLAGVTSAHVFVIRGVEYKFNGKPEEEPSGFSRVHLAKK